MDLKAVIPTLTGEVKTIKQKVSLLEYRSDHPSEAVNTVQISRILRHDDTNNSDTTNEGVDIASIAEAFPKCFFNTYLWSFIIISKMDMAVVISSFYQDDSEISSTIRFICDNFPCSII